VPDDGDARVELNRLRTELALQQNDFAAVRLSIQNEVDRLKSAPVKSGSAADSALVAALQMQLGEAHKQVQELKAQVTEVRTCIVGCC
jgi:predicted  nucleic acid-binding Zn-ribbon protein